MRRNTSVGMVLLVLVALAAIAAAPAGASDGRSVQVPVIFDGVRYEAAAFNALDVSVGADLSFVVLRDAPDLMYAFTSREEARRFLEARRSASVTSGGKLARPFSAPLASHNGNCAGHQSTSYARIFDLTNCGGTMKQLPAGTGDSDLTNDNFNDKTSSLFCSQSSPECWFYEHAGYTGESIAIQGNSFLQDLNVYGWNNRISSLIAFAFQ